MVRSRASQRQEWSKKIKVWQAGGESIARWCRNNDVATASFYYWRRRLNDSKQAKDSSSTQERLPFVELRSDSSSSSPWLEISARGLKISLEKGCDADALRHCLTLLLRLPC